MESVNKIICPCCGQEYHPSEVYMPNSLLGRPNDVVRTPDGKIDFVLGKDMNPDEEFVCENPDCNCHFYVKAKMVFNTSTEREDEQYVTKIWHNRKKEEEVYYDMFSSEDEK